MAIYHEMFGQHLRLGNFLFKYAWSIAKKEQFGEITAYPENYYLWQYLQHKPHTKENYFEYRPTANFIKADWEYSKDEDKRVSDLIINGKDSLISLDSFFQSEQWFWNYRHHVRSSLRFTDKAESDVIWKYDCFSSQKPTIGIGVRLGDFVNHGDFYQIPTSWYLSALNTYFPNWEQENEVVIFSDDIEQCKILFKDYNFKYAQPNNTHTHNDQFKHYHGDASEQLILGSLMNHWIIGNSTFSWWQAWLATYNTYNKVIHCGKVFSDTGNMKHIDTSNYYCSNWIKYEI